MKTTTLVITDCHSHWKHLQKLLLNFDVKTNENGSINYFPKDLQIINLGDEIDRGPLPLECIRFFAEAKLQHRLLSVQSNHGNKIYRYLNGNNVTLWEEQHFTLEKIKGNEDWIYDYYKDLPYYINTSSATFVHGFYAPHIKNHKRFMYGREIKNLDGTPFGERDKWYESYKGQYGWIVCGHHGSTDEIFVSKENKVVMLDNAVWETGNLHGMYWVGNNIENFNMLTITI